MNSHMQYDQNPLSRWLGGLLVLAVFMITLLAAAPDAHRHVHSDADHENHTCAVTLFANDGVAPAAAALVVFLAWVTLGFLGLNGIDRLRGNRCSLWPWALGPPANASV